VHCNFDFVFVLQSFVRHVKIATMSSQPHTPTSPNRYYTNEGAVNHDSLTSSFGSGHTEVRFEDEAARKRATGSSADTIQEHEHGQTSYSYTPEKQHGVDIEEAETDDGIDWKPGVRYQFPWIGFSGLCTIIVATSFAVGVLVASNHERVKEWPYKKYPIQPNVLLNICNQLGNLGLITLVAQGLAIAWWVSTAGR